MPNFDVRDGHGSIITIESSVVGGANRQIVTTALGNSSVMLLNSSAVIGSVAVLQGTNPWVVGSISGTVGSSIVGQLPAGTAVLGSVATLQGTNPWITTFSNSSILATQQGTVISSVINSTPSSLLTGASIFGMLPAGSQVIGSVAALQGTNPWIMSGSVTLLNGANVIGSVTALQGTNPWNISSVYGNISGSVLSQQLGTRTSSVVNSIPSSLLVGTYGHRNDAVGIE